MTQGQADSLHLPDSSVDLIVTSPPYFNLRSYQDGGVHYDGQIGAEASPSEYLDRLIDCTREWMRVLKPSGSIFVNLGDKYGKNKGLGMLPARYAIRAVDDLSLIQRAEIVWAKPNGLPESVTDRVRRSHEQVFHFVKQPRYYSAVDEVREAYSPQTEAWKRLKERRAGEVPKYTANTDAVLGGGHAGLNDTMRMNPLGKLPGSVWTIPTAPLRVPEELGIDHFAAYPPELVRRIVLGWSPREVCTACGEGRRPVMERGRLDLEAVAVIAARRNGDRGGTGAEGQGRRAGATSTSRTGLSGQERNALRSPDTITGYACACPDTTAPATPGVVLDPFGGTGTTALVASVHGRVGISVDLSADYCRLAQWRTTDEKQRAKAARTPKPKEN